MKIAIICCLHGNEKYGLEVVERLPSSISFFIGNKKALVENKRFIDEDMNRIFPGKAQGNYEEKQAFELLGRLKEFDYVIDLHSTSENCLLFGIITNPNKEKIEFAKKLGLKRLVIMPESFASGKALIDFVKCGISLEIGPHDRKENILEVKDLVINLVDNRNISGKREIFEVFEVIKKEQKNILIKNFEEVKKGQIIAKGDESQIAEFDFTAVLVGEEAYEDILCLACKKTTLKV